MGDPIIVQKKSIRSVIEDAAKRGNFIKRLEDGMKVEIGNAGSGRRNVLIDVENVLKDKSVAETIMKVKDNPQKLALIMQFAYDKIHRGASSTAGLIDKGEKMIIPLSLYIENESGKCLQIALLSQLMAQEVGVSIYTARGKIGRYLKDGNFDYEPHSFNVKEYNDGLKILDASVIDILEGKKSIFVGKLPNELVLTERKDGMFVKDDPKAFGFIEVENRWYSFSP